MFRAMWLKREMLPKRKAPLAKPWAAMGVMASGGVMFVTVEGGGMVVVVGRS